MWHTLKHKFPSPGGDYGLSDRKQLPGAETPTCQFPSPGGDYGLSDDPLALNLGLGDRWGFRPLAGITVFRTRDQKNTFREVKKSFRPLAGITVFRTWGWRFWFDLWVDEFPSPGGDYGLSDQGVWSSFRYANYRFPSPGGDYGLSDRLSDICGGELPVGFRPLAGITVFRTRYRTMSPTGLTRCFRPLAGITVFRTAKVTRALTDLI